jgi:hypothetical protein
MKIKRRFPNFFEGFEETEHEVNTREELLNIDWVKNLCGIPNHMGMYYAPSHAREKYDALKPDEYPDFLMSLTRHGKDGKVVYFVVGYIYGNGKDLGLEDYNDFI